MDGQKSHSLSYSFRLSSKTNDLSTISNIVSASKHNLRQFNSDEYNKSDIVVLRGSDKSVLSNVREIYEREFGPSLKEYNSKVRKSRTIDDYLKHVSESKSDCVCELIIMLGGNSFWEEIPKEYQKERLTDFFKDQIKDLEKQVPELKIASAIIHYDEVSPHMHIIGVPVADGYKNGLKKQCSKTKIFTKKRLEELQTTMREAAQESLIRHNMEDLIIKGKEKGRNYDIPKTSLSEYHKIIKETKQGKKELDRINQEISLLTDKTITNPIVTKDGLITIPLPELRRRNEKLHKENKKLEERNLRLVENELTEETLRNLIYDEVTEQLFIEYTPILLKHLEDKGYLNQKASEVINKIDISYCINKMLQSLKDFLRRIKEKITKDRIINKEDDYDEDYDL